MKVQVITLFAAFFGFLTVLAEPVKVGSKAELAEARAAIGELVGTGVSAEELIKAAEDCTNGSERYYLYLAAFRLQAKDKKYDQAAETLKSIREDVIGAPLAEIVAMIEKSLGKNLKEATAIQPLYRTFRAMSQAERQIVRIRKELKEKPKNAAALRVQLGEALAVTGDWEGALKSFAKGTGDVAEIAKAELSEPTATIASFWWDYEPRMKGTEAFFKSHSAALYQTLLDNNALSNIQKLTAEKRIAAARNLSINSESNSGAVGVQLWEGGPYWAECNVGASKPEDVGYYFMWGDTAGYRFVGNRWESVDGKQTGIVFSSVFSATWNLNLTKLRSEGYINSDNHLCSKHDAATKHLGSPWRLPTTEEWRAMRDYCSVKYSSQNGARGVLVMGKGAYASRSIFIPAGGFADGASIKWVDALCYWSSTAHTEEHLSFTFFANAGCSYYDCRDGRNCARLVRAVRNASGKENSHLMPARR